MDTIPDEWIDKLFLCMEKFFDKRWTVQFAPRYVKKVYSSTETIIGFHKTLWKNALKGLSYNEIKLVLKVLAMRSKNTRYYPPTCIEFFDLAKNLGFSGVNNSKSPQKDTRIAQHEIEKIRTLL